MKHFAFVWGTIGRLAAIRAALDYDLRDLPLREHELHGVAATLWHTNMAAWKLAVMP